MLQKVFFYCHCFHRKTIPVHWCQDWKPSFNYTINLLMLTYICSSVKIVIWLDFTLHIYSLAIVKHWYPLTTFFRMNNCQIFQGPFIRLNFCFPYYFLQFYLHPLQFDLILLSMTSDLLYSIIVKILLSHWSNCKSSSAS